MMKNMGYGRERLKDIVGKEAEEQQQKPTETKEEQQEPAAAKEQQQDDDERYVKVTKVKLVYEGKRMKEFSVT